MSDSELALNLEDRTIVRKQLSGLRQSGMAPGVIHNHGQPSIHVMVPEVELVKIYREAGKHHPLQLSVGSQQFLALIKDVKVNPLKRNIQHVVFQAIRQDEEVEAEVPIVIEGEIPAEKAGLMVLHQLDTVQISALPRNLVDEFKVDGNKLAELHDKITIADLKIPEGVTIITESDHPIATVVETKAQISEEETTSEDEEATEGEESAEDEGSAGDSSNQDKKEE